MRRGKRQPAQISAGAMADIAFLLLVFFLVATTFPSEKGIRMVLPPKRDKTEPPQPINERNVYVILVNSSNQLLVEDGLMELRNLKEGIKKFVLNNGRDENLSDSPKDAVVSIKTDRGSSHGVYITILDEIKAAYHEIRAKELNVTVEKYLELEDNFDDLPDVEKDRIKRVKEAYPIAISEAEPTSIGE